MEHQNCKSKTLFPFCFRMFRSSEEQMDCPYHVTGKRSAQTLDWRIKEAINARKEKHLKNNRGEGVIVQSEVDAPEPPLPSPPLPKMSKLFELPDKYKTLNNLFAAMECSIRWLALQNQLPTFRNICTQMEIQTKKKFLISHLAQMKHVFPEAIDLDTGLVHDKITLCMKPEMKVTLLMNAETCSMFPAHSPSRSLWQAFRAKLLELSLTSPEGGEIPEAWLPDPFNRGSYIDRYNVLLGEPPAEVSRYTASIVPRSVYTSGKSSSTAGLTATVAKEPETGEFCIEVLIQMIEGLGSIENFSTEVEES